MQENSLSPDYDCAQHLLAARARVVDALAHLELTNDVVELLDPVPEFAPDVAKSVAAIRAGVSRLDAAINEARSLVRPDQRSEEGIARAVGTGQFDQ